VRPRGVLAPRGCVWRAGCEALPAPVAAPPRRLAPPIAASSLTPGCYAHTCNYRHLQLKVLLWLGDACNRAARCSKLLMQLDVQEYVTAASSSGRYLCTAETFL